MIDTYKVMDIRKCIFTASLIVHLFLDCLKHLDTNKCSKNNESKKQATLQIMEYEPFLPLSKANRDTTFPKGTLLYM